MFSFALYDTWRFAMQKNDCNGTQRSYYKYHFEMDVIIDIYHNSYLQI